MIIVPVADRWCWRWPPSAASASDAKLAAARRDQVGRRGRADGQPHHVPAARSQSRGRSWAQARQRHLAAPPVRLQCRRTSPRAALRAPAAFPTPTPSSDIHVDGAGGRHMQPEQPAQRAQLRLGGQSCCSCARRPCRPQWSRHRPAGALHYHHATANPYALTAAGWQVRSEV